MVNVDLQANIIWELLSLLQISPEFFSPNIYKWDYTWDHFFERKNWFGEKVLKARSGFANKICKSGSGGELSLSTMFSRYKC